MILKYGTPRFPPGAEIEKPKMVRLTDEKAYQAACEAFDIALQEEIRKERPRSPVNLHDLVFIE